MSAQDADAETEDDGPGRREVAHRVFAAEYDGATHSYKEGDEERAPTYVVTPSGAKANRLFLVGVLTEVEQVNDQMLRARVVDPTGAFVVYAGQYQPEARATFDRAAPPAFVAVTGKARTFQPEDGDRVFSSVRPESVSVVDADTRDRWVVETARATLARVGEMAAALASGDHGDPTEGVALALEHYGTTPGYLAALRELATDAAGVVAGDRDEVEEFTASPDDDRPADLDALVALSGGSGDGRESSTAAAGTADHTASPDASAEVDADAGDDPVAAGAEAGAGPETETETGPDDAPLDGDAGTGDETSEAGVGEEIEEVDAGGEVESFDDGDDLELSGDLGETTAGDPESNDDPGEFDTSGDELDDDRGAFDAGDDENDPDHGDSVGDFEPGEIGTDEGAAVEAEPAGDELFEMDDEERERIESEYGTEFSTGTEVDAPGEADIDAPTPEEPTTEETAGETHGDDEPTDDAGPVDEGDGGVDPEADESDDTDPGADEPDGAEESGGSDTTVGDETAGEPDGAEESGGSDTTVGDDTGADDGAAEAESDTEAGEAETEAADATVDDVLLERMRELDDGNGADRETLVEAVAEETGADADSVADAIQDALMSGQCYEPGEDRLKPI